MAKPYAIFTPCLIYIVTQSKALWVRIGLLLLHALLVGGTFLGGTAVFCHIK